MNLVDANVLLYAVNEDTVRHRTAREWLDTSLAGSDTTGFAWPALTAFLRISTHASIFAQPLTPDTASEIVANWLAAPTAVVLHPTPRHLVVLRGLLETSGTGGNLVNDAHLAALALEHRATVVTFDSDFGRFDGVRVHQLG
ncbi:VapC toxin family PIN domain ribonuclease [Saccharomonospora piscinae]|uniref:Ribonuclease VapC n=1 Tax=Saccharomonospora piscinae TaxID=687388 RepID=A0A1V9AAC5_SACPI|nr:type II toxin-antitoxin system VapC family toxin [Saccharomonospora piscinae]OQO94021.1 VapC toxin family PIN domain ribonuclease [Saccharomonospora piscinae]